MGRHKDANYLDKASAALVDKVTAAQEGTTQEEPDHYLEQPVLRSNILRSVEAPAVPVNDVVLS